MIYEGAICEFLRAAVTANRLTGWVPVGDRWYVWVPGEPCHDWSTDEVIDWLAANV